MTEFEKLSIIGQLISEAKDAKDLARRIADAFELKSEATRMIDAFTALVHDHTYAGAVDEGTYRIDRITGDDGAVIIVAEFQRHGADNEKPGTGPDATDGAQTVIQPDGTNAVDVSKDPGPQADGQLVKSVEADGPLPHATPAAELPPKPVSDTAARVLDAQAVLAAAKEDPEPLPGTEPTPHDEPPGIAQVMDAHDAPRLVQAGDAPVPGYDPKA